MKTTRSFEGGPAESGSSVASGTAGGLMALERKQAQHRTSASCGMATRARYLAAVLGRASSVLLFLLSVEDWHRRLAHAWLVELYE